MNMFCMFILVLLLRKLVVLFNDWNSWLLLIVWWLLDVIELLFMFFSVVFCRLDRVNVLWLLLL